MGLALGEQLENGVELGAHFFQARFINALEGEIGLIGAGFSLEDLAGTGDGVALFIKQLLDAEGPLDVAFAIEALAGAAFAGLELGEFGLPESKDVGLDLEQAGDVTDAEVELIGNLGDSPDGVGVSADWFVLSHSPDRNLAQENSD